MTDSLRPLGLLERWYSSAQETHRLNITYVMRLAAPHGSVPTQAQLEAAMALATTHHKQLALGIFDDDVAPYWTLLPLDAVARQLKAHIRVRTTTVEQFLPSTQFEAVGKCDGETLLWQLDALVSPSNGSAFTLVLRLHHAAFDGQQCGMYFMPFIRAGRAGVRISHAIMQCLGDIRSGFVREPQSDVGELLVAPLEQQIDIRPGWMRAIWELACVSLPWLAGTSTEWLGSSTQQHVPPAERKSHMRFERIESKVVERMIVLARQNQTTVHGLLSSVAALAYASVSVDEVPRSTPLHVAVESPVDLRSRFQSSKPVFGSYICGVTTKALISRSDRHNIWDLAAYFKWGLSDGLKHGYQTVGLTAWVSGPWQALHAKLADRKPNGRECSIVLSNLGPVQFSQSYGDLALDSVHMTQHMHGEGPVVLVSAMTMLPHGAMTISFSALDICMSPAATDKFVGRFMRLLHAVAAGTHAAVALPDIQ